MSLMTCSECNKQISDTVVACPHCGFVRDKSQVLLSNNKTTTIELTGKYWKVLKLLSILMFIGGLLILPTKENFGFLVILVSIIIFISAKVGIWWNHK
jgi:hypothetical protein